MPITKSTQKAPLPKALARRAKAAAAQRQRSDQAEARELLSAIQRRRKRIAEDFYDIGEALRRLREPRLYQALGCDRFADLLEKAGISATQAHKLIAIVEQLPRSRALALGQEKSGALVSLAAATPGVDTATSLAHARVPLRGRHTPLDIAHASARAIERAATAARRSHAKDDGALAEAESYARDLTQKLVKAGAKHATVHAARMRRAGAREVIELRIAIPMAARQKLGALLKP